MGPGSEQQGRGAWAPGRGQAPPLSVPLGVPRPYTALSPRLLLTWGGGAPGCHMRARVGRAFIPKYVY